MISTLVGRAPPPPVNGVDASELPSAATMMVSPHPPLSNASLSLSSAAVVGLRRLPPLLLLLLLLLPRESTHPSAEEMKRRKYPWGDVVDVRIAPGWTASELRFALEAHLALLAPLSAYSEERRQTLRRREVVMMAVAVLRGAGVGESTPNSVKRVTVGQSKDRREELEGKPC